MLDLSDDSLSCYFSSPVWNRYNLKEVSASVLSDEIDVFLKKYPKAVLPETDALKFYLAQHAVWMMKKKYSDTQPLPESAQKLAKCCSDVMSVIPMRILSYLTLVCVEEARFINFHSQSANFDNVLGSNYGVTFLEYAHRGFASDDSKYKNKIVNNKSVNNKDVDNKIVKDKIYNSNNLLGFGREDMTLGQFLRGITGVFNFGKWQDGYGGKAWGEIARTTHDALVGRSSLIEMADHAFSLCHNNGSMFNKQKCYAMYTNQIYNILDVQASGQIPQWLANEKANKFVDDELSSMMSVFKLEFPGEFDKKIDMSLISNSEKNRKDKEKKQQKAWQNQISYSQQKTKEEAEEEAVHAPRLQAIDHKMIEIFKNKKW